MLIVNEDSWCVGEWVYRALIPLISFFSHEHKWKSGFKPTKFSSRRSLYSFMSMVEDLRFYIFFIFHVRSWWWLFYPHWFCYFGSYCKWIYVLFDVLNIWKSWIYDECWWISYEYEEVVEGRRWEREKKLGAGG